MSKKVMITGTFDPVTLGHIDIIERAAKIFDDVVVVLLKNPEKQSWLSEDIRLQMLRGATKKWDNVSTDSYDGLAIDFAKKNGISFIVRGVRDSSDFAYESEMRSWNFTHGGIETIFLPASEKYKSVSSSKAKELIAQGDFSFIPSGAKELLQNRGDYAKH